MILFLQKLKKFYHVPNLIVTSLWQNKRKEFLEILAETAEFINITEQVNECRDPKDNKYLELAVSGKAECIVTGDEDLLVLHTFRQIDILTVQNFLDKINVGV